MRNAATEINLLEQAELRTQDSMNPNDFKHIQSKIRKLKKNNFLSTNYTKRIRKVLKKVYLELSILNGYIIVMKTSEVRASKSNGRIFKIALSEFETVAA